MTVLTEQKSCKIGFNCWAGKVNPLDPFALADFIDAMPNAAMVPYEWVSKVCETANEIAFMRPQRISFDYGHLSIIPWTIRKETWNCIGGTHPTYGNFAFLWSAGGPGDEVRERPCFLFSDEEAVCLRLS